MYAFFFSMGNIFCNLLHTFKLKKRRTVQNSFFSTWQLPRKHVLQEDKNKYSKKAKHYSTKFFIRLYVGIWVEGHFNPGLFHPKLQPRTSQPQNFQPWTPQPQTPMGLKSSWLNGLGLKLGVEKSGVEMSFNHCSVLTKKLH